MDYIDWQNPLINSLKSRGKLSLKLSAFIIIVTSSLVRFFARDLTWPKEGAVWGGPIEATTFYSKQTALEDISFAFLLFGLALLLVCIAMNAKSQPEANS